MKRIPIVAVILSVATIVSGAVLRQTDAQALVNCQIFADSWFSAVEAYDDGCGSPGTTKQRIVANNVSFEAIFSFMTELTADWDNFARENTKDGDVQILPYGSFGISSQRIASSYDSQNNEYQEIYATYRVRHNTCATDLLISGTGPANDKSYAGKVFAAADAKVRENLEKMKNIAPCNPPERTPPPQTTIPPPIVTPKPIEQPPAQTMPPPKNDVIQSSPDDNQTVQMNSADVVKFASRVREEAKKVIAMKQCPGSSLPSENPCVAEKLDFITIEARESSVLVSFLDKSPSSAEKQRNAKLITLGQNKSVEITTFFTDNAFPPTDPDKLDKIRDQIIEMIEEGDTPPSWTGDVLGPGHPASFMDKEGNYRRVWENVTINDREVFNPVATGADGSRFSLVFVGENAPIVGNGEPVGGFVTVETAAEISAPSALITGDTLARIITPDETMVDIVPRSGIGMPAAGRDMSPPPPGWSDWMYDVFYGTIYVLKKEDSKGVEVRTPLTTTKSKHTKFAVLYNPEELYSATVVYEGEVEVTDMLSGLTAALTPADDGRPRALVVPLAETTKTIVSKGIGTLVVLVVFLLLISAGYFAYRKRN